MRQFLLQSEWQQLSEKGQQEVLYWLKKKQYRELNLGVCIELLADISYNLHSDDSDGRFFDNILINHESVVGWDGQELINIIWFEICQNIKNLLSNGRTIADRLA